MTKYTLKEIKATNNYKSTVAVYHIEGDPSNVFMISPSHMYSDVSPKERDEAFDEICSSIKSK